MYNTLNSFVRILSIKWSFVHIL